MINVSVDYISYGTAGSVPVSDMDCFGRGRRRCMACVYSCMLVDLSTVHVAALPSGDRDKRHSDLDDFRVVGDYFERWRITDLFRNSAAK